LKEILLREPDGVGTSGSPATNPVTHEVGG